jgi:hypothetical protein
MGTWRARREGRRSMGLLACVSGARRRLSISAALLAAGAAVHAACGGPDFPAGAFGCGDAEPRCPPEQVCAADNRCYPIDEVPEPICGDGDCQPSAGESCASCAQDCECPATCPDGSCDEAGGESCRTCPADCGACSAQCGDERCQDAESCETCPGDCNCQACPDGTCQDGTESCRSCPQDCGECDCGDRLCGRGETCASCAEDCGPCARCGNGTCDEGESCESCEQDCCCGNGECQPMLDETCLTCAADCEPCLPAPGCGNRVCGDGEQCVSCPSDCGPCSETCGDGDCVDENCASCPIDCEC